MKILAVLFALLAILLAAALLPVRPYLDFQLIFHANLGLLRGISLYDHAGQVNMIAQLAQVSPEQVYVLPFPYPPWYALTTLWLAMMSIDQASRAWFAANLAMLFLSVGLLTAGQAPPKRILFFLGGLFWTPILGSLFVGQYGFPTLLGAALMIHALQGRKAILVGLAAALLTFKPHLGALVLILSSICLAQRRDHFGRKALLAILAAGAILCGLGFLAAPSWPAAYARSLTAFQGVQGVSLCTQCVSLPTTLARLADGGLGLGSWIALVLAFVYAAWVVWRWRDMSARPDTLVAAGILVTMILSPYLVNYDYMLLAIPFILLARGERDSLEWFGMALAYVLPPISLAIWGTAGNPSLIVSACLLLATAGRAARRAARDTSTAAQLDDLERPS